MTSHANPMIRRLLSTALVVSIATPALAQRADFRWEKALPAGNDVSISNVNGDVTVKPSTSGKVEVTGTKRGNSRYFDDIKAEARETSHGVEICVMHVDDDSHCGDERGRRYGHHDWNDVRMDLEVAVPTNLRVSANTVSGDVSVDGAHGDVDANSVSGDIHLDRLHATSVHANSVSGDIDVGVDEFTGRGDLFFHSVSGNVTLSVPRGFDADLSMSTVSGDINSDFPITLGNGRMSRRRLEARIGNGGRRLDVGTVSGDLRLRQAK